MDAVYFVDSNKKENPPLEISLALLRKNVPVDKIFLVGKGKIEGTIEIDCPDYSSKRYINYKMKVRKI